MEEVKAAQAVAVAAVVALAVEAAAVEVAVVGVVLEAVAAGEPGRLSTLFLLMRLANSEFLFV